ncbi:HNH endonuclease [Porifericola rhodea]|uniref:HNH endonuclease n=1 Tax=Porifericola rhodea TaxID=930972 RepID=UPI00266615F0|nr:HNH endonuclease [Porifericola rhodea]WKN33794.1 HNH endonuclease [Porifericola rhodea]
MKLNTPNSKRKLEELLKTFNAEEKERTFGEDIIPRNDIGNRLDDGQEVDISFALVNVEDDQTLSVQGRRVLVYIRDQYYKYFPCKFHIANCSVITDFQNSGRFEKFVASLRVDGYFKVNIIHNSNYLEEGKVEQLRVCKLCLQTLNYNDYKEKWYNRETIFNNFSLDTFFNDYGTTVNKPKHTDATSPKNTYRDNWPQLSKNYKASLNYVCEDCGNDFANFKSFLHVHHINSRKDDNNYNNLKALCVKCHSKQPGHNLHVPNDL